MSRAGGVAAVDHPAPDWFRRAVAVAPEVDTLEVDGATIAVRRWGRPGRGADVLLVHGGTAHARWWDHLAPRLLRDNQVVALDLSGHGDSQWRASYSARGWAEEVAVVAAHLGGGSKPLVVGHSMGGVVAVQAAQLHGSGFAGTVVVDSFLAGRTTSPPASYESPRLRSSSVREEMVARFRLVPDAPALSFARSHVAWHSVRREHDAWRWKFDPRILTTWLLDQLEPGPAGCAVRVIRGEHGDMSPESLRRLAELIGPVAEVTTIEGAGHHLMLDRPLDLAEALDAQVFGRDW